MSVLLMKVLWTGVESSITSNITDAIDMNIGRGLEIKNNTVTLSLKNPGVKLDSAYNQIYTYVDNTFNVKFKENDQIEIYLRYTDDMADVENVIWSDTENTSTTGLSDYLKGSYFVLDVDTRRSSNSQIIRIKCADKSFILFNRLLAKSFPASDNESAPEVIQKIVRYSSENPKGKFVADGANYDVDARLDSDYPVDGPGYIQNTRKDATSFPDISVVKVWKPVYEWLGELSQIEYTNTTAELAGTLVYGKPFIMWVDEQNRFHWVETNETLTTDAAITVGTTDGIIDHNLSKSIFDVTNFVVGRGGEDFYGNGTLNYYVDPSTNVSALKMRVIAMTKIADTLINTEISEGNLVLNNTDGVFTYSGNRYDSKGYNFAPNWTTDTVTSDATYNASLRAQILKEIKAKAQKYVSGLSSARYKGTVNRKGYNQSVGSLLTFNDKTVGINNEKIRIMQVRDSVDKTGWFTSWILEQDAKAIVEES